MNEIGRNKEADERLETKKREEQEIQSALTNFPLLRMNFRGKINTRAKSREIEKKEEDMIKD